MAFGRRTAGTGTMGNGVGGTGYGTGATGVGPTRRRGWGRHRNAGGAVAENKLVGGPQTKMTDMRAASGRRMAVAGAVISEKFQRLGADIRLGFYTISHPIHPIRRAAARERTVNIKAAATGTSNSNACVMTILAFSFHLEECEMQYRIIGLSSKLQAHFGPLTMASFCTKLEFYHTNF